MITQGEGGSIVNISSIASKLAPANTAAYASSKAAINALSRSMALELAPIKSGSMRSARESSIPFAWTIWAAAKSGTLSSRP
jgi:NAD(P)-dependent dehydrogenase (short-subunit alcohol dehydrogenase family)